MNLFSKDVIDFTRQSILEKSTRSIPGIVLYCSNVSGAKPSISITATQITIGYEGSTTAITYTDKPIEDVCLSINRTSYPVTAKPLVRNTILKNGDLVSKIGEVSITNLPIPDHIPVYDRVPENGIIIRIKSVSVRQKFNSQIRVVQPYMDSAALPWYPRISVGSFTQKVNGRVFNYSIPEFHEQTWSIRYGKPFKDVRGEKLRSSGRNAFRVSRTPIFWNGENILLFQAVGLLVAGVLLMLM